MVRGREWGQTRDVYSLNPSDSFKFNMLTQRYERERRLLKCGCIMRWVIEYRKVGDRAIILTGGGET